MAGAYQTAWTDHANVLPYPKDHIQNPPHHPYETLSHHIAARGFFSARIAVEMDNYYFSARCLAVLTRSLPQSTVINSTGLVNWQRAVKSGAEITLMEKAGAISAAIHAIICDTIREGLAKT